MASNGISSRMENLDLSDQDTEDLFASPSRTQTKTHKAKQSVSEVPQTPASSNQANATPGQSRFDAEEAREAALRKELEGIRNINEVIEGVVDSLEKAKGNMDVCMSYINDFFSMVTRYFQVSIDSNSIGLLVCVAHCLQCFRTSSNLDSHPLPNGTQSTPDPQSFLARCYSRHRGCRKRDAAATAGGREKRDRGIAPTRSKCEED